MTTKVSVIIPCYNQAHYLKFVIDCLFAQTFTYWEAIIVNDGSTDNTAEVSSEYKDPRIHYVYQDNGGLASARNAGILAARGKYISFLDTDDEWAPSFLEKCVIALESSSNPKAAGVYTSCVHIDQFGNLLPQPGHQPVPSDKVFDRLIVGNFFPPNCILLYTYIVREVGMFDVTLPGCGVEDRDLWLRIAKRYEIIGLSEALSRYRLHQGSMSTNADSMHINRMAVIEKNFGSLEEPQDERVDVRRRAYAYGYFSGAMGYILQGDVDQGWKLISKTITVWPDMLHERSLYYELACGSQPRGYRGQAEFLDIVKNGAELIERLDALFSEKASELSSMRHEAYGNAYLALVTLSDKVDALDHARRFLLKALVANPRLLMSQEFIRRALKVWSGKRLVNLVNRMAGKSNQAFNS